MINGHVVGVGSVLLSEIRAKQMDRNANTLREVGNNIFQLLKDGEKHSVKRCQWQERTLK